jgi:hypothetical protein
MQGKLSKKEDAKGVFAMCSELQQHVTTTEVYMEGDG